MILKNVRNYENVIFVSLKKSSKNESKNINHWRLRSNWD